jgi:hypothetical protein
VAVNFNFNTDISRGRLRSAAVRFCVSTARYGAILHPELGLHGRDIGSKHKYRWGNRFARGGSGNDAGNSNSGQDHDLGDLLFIEESG